MLLDLYYEKSCFWAKALVAFGPFGWLLAFTKAKAGSKAQPKEPYISGAIVKTLCKSILKCFKKIKLCIPIVHL